MGTIIFIIALVIEFAFAAYCIFTKSNHLKVRNRIRIAAFTGFVIFAVLPIIDWSFRYYALAALLFLLAVIGTVALIRKKEDKKAYKAVRVVLKAIGMTVLIFVLTLPAIIFPQNVKVVETTGEYQVATATYTYTDTSRVETYTDTGEKRKLNVKMWYPENADGTFPLIVFSHGSLGTKTSNQSLYNELASHGYVVCSIDHTYQCFFTTDENGHTTLLDMGFFKELMTELSQDDRQFSYDCYQKWMKIRMGDINFVIDSILAGTKNKDGNRVYKLVDTTKIGVMGHSLGGSAALGTGRERNDVSAVIALESPFMWDIKSVKDGEFVYTDEKYPVPLLDVYSDDSWSHLGEWPQYVENHDLLSNTNATAFNVYISGVGHLTLTDLALESPFLASALNEQKSMTKSVFCLKTLNKVCLEFFDSYLKGEGKFTSAGTY